MTIEFVGNSVNLFVIVIQKILDVTNAKNCRIVLEIDKIYPLMLVLKFILEQNHNDEIYIIWVNKKNFIIIIFF
jgi:hypothetical protein